MPKYKNLLLDEQLCFALYKTTNMITRAFRGRLEKVGLTYSQYLVLLALWETEPLSIKELAQRLYLNSATLTPVVKRLESAGLLTRQRNKKDERIVNVSLTAEGRELRHQVSKIQIEVTCQTGLSPADMADFRSKLHRLSEVIEPELII